MKLKWQEIGNDFGIKAIINKANDESKLKRKAEVIECKTRNNQKPFLRKVKRDKILLEARNETKSFECEDSIVVKIEQKEKQLKEETKDGKFKGAITKATSVWTCV